MSPAPWTDSPEPLVLEDDYTVAPRSHPVSHPPVDAPLCVTCRYLSGRVNIVIMAIRTIVITVSDTDIEEAIIAVPTICGLMVPHPPLLLSSSSPCRHLDLSFFDPSCPGCGQILTSR